MSPSFLYGTAWKEDDTERCVRDALAAGFRAIDTANQRKHYYEEGVGRGVAASGIARSALWLQTKFTFIDGQDQRLPYDPRAPIATQVAQSFASSCEHLRTDYLDSLVLHGPSQREGLGADDHEAWRAMETIAESGRARALGVSNVTPRQIEDLVAFARVKPSYVQNRCYARVGWDALARKVCRDHGITYQGFSLLTANRQVLANKDVAAIASRHGRTIAQVVFRFCQQVGMLPLTGTTDPTHMREDLAMDFELSPADIATLDAAG
ncbi:MAG TPA: aldo/keto reductase [Kofleriaceae bacterium]|nr:aldo/keto reductase [Kofleriaceae bacterium]